MGLCSGRPANPSTTYGDTDSCPNLAFRCVIYSLFTADLQLGRAPAYDYVWNFNGIVNWNRGQDYLQPNYLYDLNIG